MHDDIHEAFAQITVADFERDTSATVITPHLIPKLGENAFDRFVEGQLAHARREIAADGRFQPWSVLSSPVQERMFVPDEDENVLDYAARLRREASTFRATWMFTALLSYGRSYDPDDDDQEPLRIDPDDDEALQAAFERGEIEVCLCWYAERLETDGHHYRAGIIGLDEGVPGKGTEGAIDPERNPFHYVLGGDGAGKLL